MTNAEHTLSLVRQALEDLDQEYMDNDVPASSFAEEILDKLNEIVSYERTKGYEQDGKFNLKAGDDVWVRAKVYNDPFSQIGKISIIIKNYVTDLNPKDVVRDWDTKC